MSSVCVTYGLPSLLSDDTAARLAGKALNLESYGTLGLLIRSVRKEHRTKEEVLSLLTQIPKRTTLHIKPSLLQNIIQKLYQEWH
jgi:predicted nucleic acid-binding protein